MWKFEKKSIIQKKIHKLEKNHCSKKSTDKQIHELKKFMSSKIVQGFEKISRVEIKITGILIHFVNLEKLCEF